MLAQLISHNPLEESVTSDFSPSSWVFGTLQSAINRINRPIEKQKEKRTKYCEDSEIKANTNIRQ